VKPTEEMVDLVVAAAKAYDDWTPDDFRNVAGETVAAVLALVERDLIARVEGKRDTGLCDCACDDEPISPRTGLPMDHHCDCRAVTTAGLLLGSRRKTKHVAECSCDWDEP